MKKFTSFLMLSFALQLSAETLGVDPKASKVSFSIHKFKIGKDVEGEFEKFSGTFDVDAKTKLLKSAKGEIQAASFKTDSSRRDKHVKNDPKFFDVDNHKLITFVLNSHTGTPEKGVVKGMLTIKNNTKPVELAAVVKNSDPKAYEIDLTGKIDRKEFDVTWNDVLDKGGFVLADEVTLKLSIKGQAPAATKM